MPLPQRRVMAMMSARARAGATGDPSSRMRYLDSLRGIAALLVLWLHVAQTYRPIVDARATLDHALYATAQGLDIGRVGVVLFFLISGFVIPFSFDTGRPDAVRAFVIKRVFRIYPAYWLSVPLGALATCWLWGIGFGVRDVLVNLTLLQELFGVRSAQGVYWTLLVELVFYALCIVLLRLRCLDNPVRIAAIAILLSMIHSVAVVLLWLGTPVPGRAAAFWCLHLSLMLCGTLYRLWFVAETAARRRIARYLLIAILGYYVMILPAGASWAIGFYNNYAIADALGIVLFIVGTRFVRIESRVTDWLGAISYSVYLLHLVVASLLLWWLRQPGLDAWWSGRSLAFYLMLNVILTVTVAGVVHAWLERPFNRLGHRLVRDRTIPVA